MCKMEPPFITVQISLSFLPYIEMITSHIMKYTIIILTLLMAACHSSKETYYEPKSNQTPQPLQAPAQFGESILIDTSGAGQYVLIDLPEDQWPQPKEGTLSFLKSLYSSVKYPATARQNGIQGQVLIDIWVNELGQATFFSVEESAHISLDQASLSAVKYASQPGFTVLMYNGKAVPYRSRIPVKFKLQK